jgi:hypothetical protein
VSVVEDLKCPLGKYLAVREIVTVDSDMFMEPTQEPAHAKETTKSQKSHKILTTQRLVDFRRKILFF